MAKKMNVEQLPELLTKIKQRRRDNATKKNATNQDENDCGSTELIKAVRNNDEKKVKSIIEQSNRLNVTDDLLNKKLDKDGRSALHESCKSGYHDIAHYLIMNNANVDLSDNMGRTPLHLAVIHGNSSLPLGRLHLEWKDGQLCYKEIPNSNCKVVKLLLEKGASIETEDNHGYTALFWACAASDISMVELLVAYGADINRKIRGETAKNIAYLSGQHGIVGYLKRCQEERRRMVRNNLN